MAVISSMLAFFGSVGLAFGIGGGVITGGALAGTVIATTSSIIGGMIITGCVVFGGVSTAISLSKRNQDFGAMSPSYGNLLQTQTDQNLPVPLLYGTCKLAGNRIWQDENAQSTVKRIVAFAEGEICEYSEIKLNDIPIEEISGISIGRYYGTSDQVVDGIVGGSNQSERAEKVGSLRNIAYLAVTVPRSSKIDINYNLTAVVKGRKIRVYKNRKEYEIKYSENPAWVMFDFLTCYNGLGLCINDYGTVSDNLVQELFDLDSFIESAAYCDEIITYRHKDKDGNDITEYVPRFTFNMIFDSQTSARTLIDEIYRSCRGGLFIKDGRLQFKIDKIEPVSRVFTDEDIVRGSETFQTVPKEEHYDILKCTYISPEHEWQKVEATAEIPEYRDGVPIEHSVNLYSCTSFNQASRLAWYYVNSKRLQPYFGSFQTDYKGYDLEVGDVIAIDSLLMGLNNYKVKVTSVTDNGAGIFTIDWRNYDENLYTDELGSREPKVLISTIEDKVKYPDDVKNFNVVQSNNLFSFVWNQNPSINDSYEIRMGETWENASVIASDIRGNSFNMEIPSNGLFKFWIKAFNGYNFSENASLDAINVDSVPNVNEVVTINVLEEISGILDDNLRKYQNTIKFKEADEHWCTTNDKWENYSGFYQNLGYWGIKTAAQQGVYLSQVFDIGDDLESIVSFSYKYTSADEQNSVLVEWSYSSDGKTYTDWTIVNTGKYTFRYFKVKVTLRSVNNIQTVFTDLIVSVDVPDKDLDMELEITDPEGLIVEYNFIKPPSIVATVNDNNDAYVVVAEKTNSYALIKAYTNAGDLTTCKLSLRAKGY